MNHSLKVLASAFVLLISSASYAQMKIGHVNQQEILQAMPGYKMAQDTLQIFLKQLNTEYETMMKEYTDKKTTLENGWDNMLEPIRQSKLKELMSLEQRIGEFQQDINDLVQEEQLRLLKPLADKIDAAIAAIAKEKGYNYILDTSMGTVLYVDEKNDVTELVKTKLGIAG